MSLPELIDMGEGVRMKARGGGESMKKTSIQFLIL
jgi:hypothetical protein